MGDPHPPAFRERGRDAAEPGRVQSRFARSLQTDLAGVASHHFTGTQVNRPPRFDQTRGAVVLASATAQFETLLIDEIVNFLSESAKAVEPIGAMFPRRNNGGHESEFER